MSDNRITFLNELIEHKALSPKERIKELFTVMPAFKQWIEQTSLFSSIKINSKLAGGKNITIEAGYGLTIQLNGTPIDIAEELPVEIIAKFYENYPHNKETNNLKTLENDSTIPEA